MEEDELGILAAPPGHREQRAHAEPFHVFFFQDLDGGRCLFTADHGLGLFREIRGGTDVSR